MSGLLTTYIGADGHIYIRLYGYLMWRLAERVPQYLLDSEHLNTCKPCAAKRNKQQ